MILEKQKESMIHQEGETQESIAMSLDLDSAQMLMQMLSKNLYSDAIGSTIREWASNALDSHRRAGTDKPIIVSFGRNSENNYEFSVEDFGLGLDDEDVKNIISKYGKSTKRESAIELGMFGLGFKAGLAYSSSFYFVCRKNGMERKYMMYEGENINTIDLLYEAPTEEPNGVKMIVPVQYYDRYHFESKIKEQLAYFENVYFNVQGISNDFSIVRSEHFQFSELCSTRTLHMCLDNVYYPLDFNKLGIDRIELPVALRFSLSDGIFPTPNREAIRYTQEAKAVILKKIELAANYFVEKYNETVQDTDDFRKVIEYHQSRSRNLMIGNNKWDIHPLAKYAMVKMASPKMSMIKLLDLEKLVKMQEYILGEYEPKFTVTQKFVRDAKRYYGLTHVNRLKDIIYVYESDRVSGLKKDYLKHLQGNRSESVIFRKMGNFRLRSKGGAYDNYYNILQLQNHPKSEWRQRIQELQTIIKGITKNFIDLDAMEVPQEFIDSRKKQRISTGQIKGVAASGPRKIKLKGEMICKQAEPLERWVDGKNCKWVSKTHDMSKFHQNKYLMVYGKQEDMDGMDGWFKAVANENIRLAILSERELKLVEKIELHNLIPFNKFMEGKNKPFQRIATACLIDQLSDRYRNSFNMYHNLSDISIDLYNKFDKLSAYKDKNMPSINDEVRNTIIEHAEDINAFDPEIISDFKDIKSIYEKLPFLDVMLGNMPRYAGKETDLMKQALIDLFKYHRHRIDWKNYNIRFNEDLPLEETLTTETVEELVQQD